jgi:hypothetical protein
MAGGFSPLLTWLPREAMATTPTTTPTVEAVVVMVALALARRVVVVAQ